MSFNSIWTFAQSHWFIASIFAFFAFCFFVTFAVRAGFNFWYMAVIAAAAIFTSAKGYPIYFWPFLLGMVTAFAEIISKFKDEPMKAINTGPALLYHVLNGVIAAFALYFLALTAGKPGNFAGVPPLDQLKYALAAGFGAMLIMRSKLFNIKVGEDNVSFGPEQIINIIFNFMESAIDRIRARARRAFIREKLGNIKFDAVYAESVMTVQRASRTFTTEEVEKCVGELQTVHSSDSDVQMKSYELGYIIYDKLGEAFVNDLFSNLPRESLIRPPDPDDVRNAGVFPAIIKVEADNAFIKAMPFLGTKEELVPYLAYGTNMSSNRICERLNWLDSMGKESLEKTNPTRCELKDFRLAFNRLSHSRPNEEGLANLVSETGGMVEGVVYHLPKPTMEFLKNNEQGYHSIKVQVTIGGKKTDKIYAEVLVADTDKVGPELPPNLAELTSMIEGAAERGLSPTYLDKLKSFEPAPAMPAKVTTGGNGGGTT